MGTASRKWIHLTFAASLAFLLANRYFMIGVLSQELVDGAIGRLIGASAAYLLIWGTAYWLCLKTPASTPLLLLGLAAMPISLYTLPLVGFIMIALLALIARWQRRKTGAISRTTVLGDDTAWPLRISPYRALSVLFWSLLLLYFHYHSRLLLVILAIVLILLVWSRFNPISAGIVWAYLSAPFSGAGRRGYNEMVARKPQIEKADVAQLVKLLKTTNPFVRGSVIKEILKKGDHLCVPQLMESVSSLRGPALANTLDCVGQLAIAPQASLLIPFLDNALKRVRETAAHHLGRLDNPIAIRPLATAFATETDPKTRATQFTALLKLNATTEIASAWTDLAKTDRETLIEAVLRQDGDLPVQWAPIEQVLADDTNPKVKKLLACLRRKTIWTDTRKQFPQLDVSEKAPKHLVEEVLHFQAPVPAMLWRKIKAHAPAILPSRQPKATRLRLSFKHCSTPNNEVSDVIRAKMTIELSQKDTVQVTAYFSVEHLFEAVTDARQVELRFLSSVHQRWRQAFDTAPLAENLYYFDDIRDMIDLVIGGQTLSIRRKYFTCRTDVAFDAHGTEGDPALLLCFKGVFECNDYEELPPFVACLNLMDFICEAREVGAYDEASEQHGPLASPRIQVL